MLPDVSLTVIDVQYDMLCFEGIAMQLNVFRGREPMPRFQRLDVAEDEMQTITVTPDTARVRPLVAGAVLRNMKFTQTTYDSFIGLQDKLHQNLARQRTLVGFSSRDGGWHG